MEFEFKVYKFLKIKNYFENTKIIFLFNWIKGKKIKNQNLLITNYKTNYSLIYILLQKSRLNFVKLFFNGPMLLTSTNHADTNLRNLTHFSGLISFFCLKLNSKIYSILQLRHISFLNYTQMLNILQKFLIKSLHKHKIKFFN